MDDPYGATAAAFASVIESGRWQMHPPRADQTGPRLRALLEDTLADQAKACRREISLLAAVADAGGVPLDARGWVTVAELDRRATQIADDRALRFDFVRWAVGIWVSQLPVTLLAEPPPSTGTPGPASGSPPPTDVGEPPPPAPSPSAGPAPASPASPLPAAEGAYAPTVHDLDAPTTPWSPGRDQAEETDSGSAGSTWLKPVAVVAAIVVVLAVAAAVVVFRPKDTTIITSDPPAATTAPARQDTAPRSSTGGTAVAVAPTTGGGTTAPPTETADASSEPPGVIGTFALPDGWRATQTSDGASVDGSTVTLAGVQNGYPTAELLGPGKTSATLRRTSVLARNDLRYERDDILDAARKSAKQVTILEEGMLGPASDIAYFASAQDHDTFQSVNVDGIAVVPDDDSYNASFWVSCSKTDTSDDPAAIDACKQLIASFRSPT